MKMAYKWPFSSSHVNSQESHGESISENCFLFWYSEYLFHTHTYAHARTPIHTRRHRWAKNAQVKPSVQILVRVCVCECVCVCVFVCVCVCVFVCVWFVCLALANNWRKKQLHKHTHATHDIYLGAFSCVLYTCGDKVAKSHPKH